MLILIIVFVLVVCFVPLVHVVVFNLYRIIYYIFADVIDYIKNRRWFDFNCFGIDMFVAMFGKGKTLSMTKRANELYRHYGNKLRFISNYHLNDIPYIPLVNFNQLIDLGSDDDDEGYVGTVVLIDEISSVLSHRNFASFPLEMLSMLCQQRKRKIYILCSAQRFFMVDKIWRGITTRVVICDKYWRLIHNEYYDAWEYENATTQTILNRQSNFWWFCRNKDYAAYDTSEMITRTAASDFISNEEAIVRKGLDSSLTCNDAAVHLNKKAAKARRKKS